MLRLWARNDLARDTWWRQLRPHLSAQGRQDYTDTDPARLPDLHVLGSGHLRQTAHSMWARVDMATSRGTFGVELTRPTPTAPWVVDRLDFPEGLR